MRINQSHIETLVDRINIATGSPVAPWTDRKANTGNYHIDYAYGGASLHHMVDANGCVSDVLSCGHIPKKELYYRMQAFLKGLKVGE